MKEHISCQIIQDLLPNYIEGIVSSETKELVKEHLETCDYCKKEYENMNEQIRIDPVHERKLDYLKGIHKKLRNVLILCIVLCFASFLIFGLYYEPNFGETMFTLILYSVAGILIFLRLGLPLLCSIISFFWYKKNKKKWLLLVSAICICILIFSLIRIYKNIKYDF